MEQENLTVVNCSPRFIRFIQNLIESICLDLENTRRITDFLFVINECKNEKDFYNKAKDSMPESEKDSTEEIIKDIISKSKKVGRIAYNNKYKFEVGSLEYAYRNYDYDQYLLLQCSYETPNSSFYQKMFQHKGLCTIGHGHWGGGHAYLIKFTHSVLKELGNSGRFPVCNSKTDSVMMEGQFSKIIPQINRRNGALLNWNDAGIKEKFGRKNHISKSGSTLKYRGTWNASMIENAWK